MAITDELRSFIKDPLLGYASQEQHVEQLTAIADRIDSAHAHGMEERADRYSELRAKMNNCYVELPKDADGEYIHIGDVMESGDGDVFIVSSVDYGLHSSYGRGKFWMLWNEDADFYERAYECRHHKQPTVEDVLWDMHVKLDEVAALHADEPTDSDERERDVARIFAEYSAKLQLRGDAE